MSATVIICITDRQRKMIHMAMMKMLIACTERLAFACQNGSKIPKADLDRVAKESAEAEEIINMLRSLASQPDTEKK